MLLLSRTSGGEPRIPPARWGRANLLVEVLNNAAHGQTCRTVDSSVGLAALFNASIWTFFSCPHCTRRGILPPVCTKVGRGRGFAAEIHAEAQSSCRSSGSSTKSASTWVDPYYQQDLPLYGLIHIIRATNLLSRKDSS